MTGRGPSGEKRRVDWFNERGMKVQRTAITCCGEELVCARFTNTCSNCGSDFNMSGELLADRSQWGEETGESVSDILQADYDGFDGDGDW